MGSRWDSRTDERGLVIEVFPTAGMLWHYRYRVNGKPERVTLGRYPALSPSCGHFLSVAAVGFRAVRWCSWRLRGGLFRRGSRRDGARALPELLS